MYWYIESNDLDEDDKETIRLSQDYYDYIKDELERHLEDAKSRNFKL